MLRAWLLAVCLAVPAAAGAETWTAAGRMAMLEYHAELRTDENPAVLLVRLENRAELEPIHIGPHFIRVLDGAGLPVRPVPVESLVSERLEKLRELLPESRREIDALLGEIRADYPQEKVVEAYARLKRFLEADRPLTWRTRLENWLLGRERSGPSQAEEAAILVEEIGDLARNYLWPRDLAPGAVYTGMVFFRRPPEVPPSVFFAVGGKSVLGRTMNLESSR